MKRTTSGFVTALQLLCRIPIRSRGEPDFRRFGFYLPLVGLPAGLLVAAVGVGATLLIREAGVAAIIALVVQYLVFNIFHFDGLLDSADAFLGPGDAERTRRILKDSRIGVFALFAGTILILLKTVLLARVFGDVISDSGWLITGAIVAGMPVAGRSAAGFLGATLAPANPGGLGAAIGRLRPRQVAAGFIFTAGVVVAAAMIISTAAGDRGWVTPATVGGCLVAGSLTGWIVSFRPYKRRLAGLTGDAYGLAIELGELAYLVALLIASVAWGGPS